MGALSSWSPSGRSGAEPASCAAERRPSESWSLAASRAEALFTQNSSSGVGPSARVPHLLFCRALPAEQQGAGWLAGRPAGRPADARASGPVLRSGRLRLHLKLRLFGSLEGAVCLRRWTSLRSLARSLADCLRARELGGRAHAQQVALERNGPAADSRSLAAEAKVNHACAD